MVHKKSIKYLNGFRWSGSSLEKDSCGSQIGRHFVKAHFRLSYQEIEFFKVINSFFETKRHFSWKLNRGNKIEWPCDVGRKVWFLNWCLNRDLWLDSSFRINLIGGDSTIECLPISFNSVTHFNCNFFRGNDSEQSQIRGTDYFPFFLWFLFRNYWKN